MRGAVRIFKAGLLLFIALKDGHIGYRAKGSEHIGKAL
jgi:hypothetical protein